MWFTACAALLCLAEVADLSHTMHSLVQLQTLSSHPGTCYDSVHLCVLPNLKDCVRSQYACMFISAGEPGNVKKIQASVATARKVFRIMRVRLSDGLLHAALAIKSIDVVHINRDLRKCILSRLYSHKWDSLSILCLMLGTLTSDLLMQPFESIMPIINNPAINTNKPLTLELLAKVCTGCPGSTHSRLHCHVLLELQVL